MPSSRAQSVLALTLIIACASSAVAQEKNCAPRNAITASVKSVSDGRTFTLTDGREIRLLALEAPTAEAQAALSTLILGREINLSPLAPEKDRYGRLNMRAFTGQQSQESIEATLIAQGVALAAPRGDDDACMAALLKAEGVARAQKLGLWNDAARTRMQAQDPAALMAAHGQFAVVEGKVISVRESGGTVYVNFGRRWSEDFTVTILKRNAQKFTAAGLDPKKLEGRRVRVRGWIEERGGPWIEAALPEQIELAE